MILDLCFDWNFFQKNFYQHFCGFNILKWCLLRFNHFLIFSANVLVFNFIDRYEIVFGQFIILQPLIRKIVTPESKRSHPPVYYQDDTF